MPFDEEHLNVFKSTLSDSLPTWVGMPPRSWAECVFEAPNQPEQPQNLSQTPLSRHDLFAMTTDQAIGDQAFALSVLAWGGMNRRHGRTLLGNAETWLPVVSSLRRSSVDSMTAYEQFQELRTAGSLPGMGPAYFTKLIFFAAPAHDGFIMDQWTARSVNLLRGEPVVHTIITPRRNGTCAHTVSDKNSKFKYADFCASICELAKTVGYEGREALVEEALFSTGRGKGRWRNYVIMHDDCP